MSRSMAGSAAPGRGRSGDRVRPRVPWAVGTLGLLIFGAGVPVFAAAAAPETPASPVVLMPLDQIRPGMQGIARTVFEGSNLEEFKVEILGVLQGAIGPQQDLIVARLRGDKVEYTGVVSGMSGSPVYIDGKLIGAVSYRLGNFAKEPIAGITPIAGAAGGAPRSGPEAPSLAAGGGFPGGLQPIGIPLVCSGCDPGVLRYYAPIFEAYGLEPTAGGGATTSPSSLPLLPGTAIGAALATGDMNVVGIGTLTYIDRNRVFAFGHPMLGTGPLEMPMTQAQVLLTFASSAASFKIANSTPPVGTIVQDGLTAIVGEVGREAPTIPVSVRVTSRGIRRDFHYAIMRSRAWSPVL